MAAACHIKLLAKQLRPWKKRSKKINLYLSFRRPTKCLKFKIHHIFKFQISLPFLQSSTSQKMPKTKPIIFDGPLQTEKLKHARNLCQFSASFEKEKNPFIYKISFLNSIIVRVNPSLCSSIDVRINQSSVANYPGGDQLDRLVELSL